jgi:hypothetical protein
MNRLILIGNGFDLAHGLKTSYHDFILDYLKGCIVAAIEDESNSLTTYNNNNVLGYSDELIEVFVSKKYKISFPSDSFSNFMNIPKLIDDIKSAKSITNILNLTNNAIIIIKHKSDFTQSLFNECITKNWVDIEGMYYEELKKYLKEYNIIKQGSGKVSILVENLKHLNHQLDFIKKKLQGYLKSLDTRIEIQGLRFLIHENIFYKKENPFENNILFLNFNYTNTSKQYLRKEGDSITNIHGELTNPNNPLIFGYGDEVDKHYNEIEDLNVNEFFKHIKSFDYFKTPNYSNLLRFIEQAEFEIFVMGHSCGLSDRTMLSTIFEHNNCTSIKIFYNPKDKDDYKNKTFEISRHFKDKASMRKKIIPLPNAAEMPQEQRD